MPAIYIKGDIFNYPGLDAISHGCNCAGAMGRGIAKEFKKRYPQMYVAYREKCKKGEFNLGDIFIWEEKDIKIFNLGTQETWKTKAILSAIEESVEKMCNLAIKLKINKIGIPRMGAGLGGLEWSDVKKTLQKIAGKYSIELVVFEIYKKSEMRR